MDQILKCRDLGLICNYLVCGETKDEVLKKTKEHTEVFHYMKDFSKAFLKKAGAAIHAGACEKEMGEACPAGLCAV